MERNGERSILTLGSLRVNLIYLFFILLYSYIIVIFIMLVVLKKIPVVVLYTMLRCVLRCDYECYLRF